jgi:tetrahydromethanopterin S-methyltransferase subunit A
MAHSEASLSSPLHVIQEQIEEAIAAPKCHKCGCLQQTVVALSETAAGKAELASVLADAKRIFVPKQYDCLGCPVCFPAIAANAFAEAFPEAGSKLDLCPTEEPGEREGWPPLPGDFSVVRYGAPVAVCALNTASLVQELASVKPPGLSIAGTMHTENLGIERVIKNCLANPNVRFLLLCGEDTQQAVGHLPGQSFESLIRNGIDERGRIVGAKGRRPVLKNVTYDEVQAFRQQVELVSMIGEQGVAVIVRETERCANRNPGEFPSPFRSTPIQRVVAERLRPLVLDRAGYFVIYPDQPNRRLVVERRALHESGNPQLCS